MEVDEHLLWLLSALRLARGTDGGNKDKVIQTVNNCFLRVKKERKAVNLPASQAPEELREFQAKASVLLLLCLPKIRQLSSVENCEDFQSIISSLSELPDSVFFTVVRTQKMYCLLFPLLSWLPPNVVQALTLEYFHYTDEVTPVTLTMSVELLKALLFSHQYRPTHPDNSQSNTECFELLMKFFSSKTVSSETPSMIKLSGYLFMYMFECLYLLLASYVGCKIREPDTITCTEGWTKLWKTQNTSTEDIPLSYTKETIKSLLVLCQNNNREVTVDMWMAWSEQMLPPTVTVHVTPTVQLGNGRPKSIQLVTCNIAFDILKILGDHSQLEESLGTNQCQELLQFLQQVATDPDYDPDQDLTLQQLIEEINIKDDRQGKLLDLLVQRDGIIASDDACACLKEHAAVLDSQMRIQLLQNCIEWIKGSKPFIPEAKNVILDIGADLSPEQLILIIEGSLSAGLDDTLKTPYFKTQLTAVFNQVADENTAEPSGKHVWLCLQSGRAVVEQAVRLAVTMTGLVPVMVQALADIPQVCQAKLPSGDSVLASTLVGWQTSELCDREEQEFIVLVKNLLSVKGLLHTQEVLQLMVEPFIVIESNKNLEKLILPLELFKEVVSQDVDVVVSPGPGVVSLVVALVHVVDATVCLEGQGASRLLTIRSLASTTLMEVTNVIAANQKKFRSEIVLLQQMVGQYSLHSWSVMYISRVLDAELSGDSGVDLLLQALMKASPDLPQEHTLNSLTFATAGCERLKEMSKSEWIISLLQLLPHCSESEWISAFFLTDGVLGSQNTVFPVLEVFHGVLHLVCESLASTPLHQEESQSLPPPVSLQHCFTFFASATMIYLEEKLKVQNSRERFISLADIFCWWCCTVPSFCCSPELPSLLLARLCGALEDMVVSSKLKVFPEEHTHTGSDCDSVTIDGSEKETDLLPKFCIDKVNDAIGEEKERQCVEINLCNKQRKGFGISRMDMKKELDQVTFFMAKYVPYSKLLASVASKLKKLYEF